MAGAVVGMGAQAVNEGEEATARLGQQRDWRDQAVEFEGFACRG